MRGQLAIGVAQHSGAAFTELLEHCDQRSNNTSPAPKNEGRAHSVDVALRS
jgi:hypothetical protein